jgi:hypothetical protein
MNRDEAIAALKDIPGDTPLYLDMPGFEEIASCEFIAATYALALIDDKGHQHERAATRRKLMKCRIVAKPGSIDQMALNAGAEAIKSCHKTILLREVMRHIDRIHGGAAPENARIRDLIDQQTAEKIANNSWPNFRLGVPSILNQLPIH